MRYKAFEIGDQVRVINRASPYSGLTGIVRSVDEPGMVPEPIRSHHVELQEVQTVVPGDKPIFKFCYEELELVAPASDH